MFHHMELDKIQVSSLDIFFLPSPKQRWQLETDGLSFILLLFWLEEQSRFLSNWQIFSRVKSCSQCGKWNPNAVCSPTEFWSICCVADLCLIDQVLCRDENALLSFEAICSIHKLMDEDDDGTVDTAETDEVSVEAPPHRSDGPKLS